MGLFLALALCLAATATGFQELPPEENPRYFPWQDVKNMTSIRERLYVVSRNYNITTPNRCHSAIKTAAPRHDLVIVALRTHSGGLYGPPVEFKSPFLTSRTGTHKRDNAVTYRLHPSHHPVQRKLMYIDEHRRCLILVERVGYSGRRGCQLLMTASALDYTRPRTCVNLYHRYCPGPKVTLYHRGCKFYDAFIDQKAISGGFIRH